MAGLPFVVQPRLKPIKELIGSDESGKIEVERRGYLTVGEKSFVQQARTSDTGTIELITLSRKVAKEFGLGLDDAYNAVVEIISGQGKGKRSQQIEEKFAEEMQGTLTSLANAQNREDMIMAAALLINRVDTEFDISSINKVHPDIIQGLAALYREEEARNIEKLKDADEETKKLSVEELEKKPDPENPST